MLLYALRYPAGGCDPDSDAPEVYTKRPILDWDSYGEIVTFSVPDFNSNKTLWALVERTARCCGSGQIYLILAYSRSRLRSMATALNAGTPAWAVPRTDWEDMDGIPVEAYRVVPVMVETEFQIGAHKTKAPKLDSTAWDSGMVLQD